MAYETKRTNGPMKVFTCTKMRNCSDANVMTGTFTLYANKRLVVCLSLSHEDPRDEEITLLKTLNLRYLFDKLSNYKLMLK